MKKDIIIVGGGFAGASTAFHLSQSFSGSILLIEKEEIPGFHASGRNASLVLQSTPDPEIRQAIVASRQSYLEYSSQISRSDHGSLHLGKKDDLEKLRDLDLFSSEYRDPEEIIQQIPLLKGHNFQNALWTPTDGTLDISALLQFYLEKARSRGVEVWFNCELSQVDGKETYRVQTSKGTIETSCLVNAAGAWARQVAKKVGATEIPLIPSKRHLFVLDTNEKIEHDWPFVWDHNHDFYFRPESGGLLFSICDEEDTDNLAPTINPTISESLAELIWKQLPALRQATQREVWSCFRTKPPDASFVIGWDLNIKNFFWVTGLGGHGVGASWEIGRLAAAGLQDPIRQQPNSFPPVRFTTTQ